MDWTLIIFFGVLLIAAILVILAIASLPPVGDERKNFIKAKAQSYAFAIVIALLLWEMSKNIYIAFWGDGVYTGINPFTFLLTISITYLLSLLFFKKKYGG